MRPFGLAFIAIITAATAAIASERVERFERSLQMLAPDERLEQLCDYTAMKRIRKDTAKFRPDRAIANATAEPHIRNDTIVAKGGAFRSHRKWYALSFTCTATPDRMTVLTFHYKIGPEIPQTKWASDGLWR